MDISLFKSDITTFEGDLIVIGRYQDEDPSSAEKTVNQTLNGALDRRASRHRFVGKSGQSVGIDTAGQMSADRVYSLA